MAIVTKTFVSAYTSGGVPAVGLSPLPTIDIWEVATMTQVVPAGVATEIAGGWYKYDFPTFDTTKAYVATWDGGTALLVAERTFFGATEAEPVEAVASSVWAELMAGNMLAGSFGEGLSLILGLSQHNTVNDLVVVNPASGFQTSGRIRFYDTKANALAAGATGLIATYTFTAVEGAIPGTAASFTLVKEP